MVIYDFHGLEVTGGKPCSGGNSMAELLRLDLEKNGNILTKKILRHKIIIKEKRVLCRVQLLQLKRVACFFFYVQNVI